MQLFADIAFSDGENAEKEHLIKRKEQVHLGFGIDMFILVIRGKNVKMQKHMTRIWKLKISLHTEFYI
jgi:hypothetical protein